MRLGAVELVDLRNMILGGERGAKEIAAHIGCTERTVERERKRLREQGYRLVPADVRRWLEEPQGRCGVLR